MWRVKVIRTERFGSEILTRTLKRFEREAKALARLTHPNIVKVTDYGEHEGSPYLVMPYLIGGTLKQRLKQGSLPWSEAVRLLLPIAEALGYAHSQGIVHRDVKPSNILLTQSGQPMLTDFGVAKVVEEEATADLTGTAAAVGTPEYMAPEQTGRKIDHRVDIYALGIVLYEMLTGRRPYEADTPLAVLIKQASEKLPPPSRFTPDLPRAVEKVLLKALAKKPDDRYQSMDEFAREMEMLLAGGEDLKTRSKPSTRVSSRFTGKPVEDKAGSPPLPPSKKRIGQAWIGGIVVFLVVGLIFVVGFLWRGVTHPGSASLEASPSLSVLPARSQIVVTQTAVKSPTLTDTTVPTFTQTLPPTITSTSIPMLGLEGMWRLRTEGLNIGRHSVDVTIEWLTSEYVVTDCGGACVVDNTHWDESRTELTWDCILTRVYYSGSYSSDVIIIHFSTFSIDNDTLYVMRGGFSGDPSLQGMVRIP